MRILVFTIVLAFSITAVANAQATNPKPKPKVYATPDATITISEPIVPPSAPASIDHTPSFAGLPWGASPAYVRQVMKSKGYGFDKQTASGDLYFNGSVDNRPAEIHCLFSPTVGLVKEAIWIHTGTHSLSDARQVYNDTVAALTKYGQPSQHEIYKWPYERGDGHEDTAVAVGKLDIFSMWDFATDNQHQPGIVVDIARDFEVNITYESSFWSSEVDRRKGNANSDL